MSGRAAKAARRAWQAHIGRTFDGRLTGMDLDGLYSAMRDRMVGLRLGRPGTRWPRFAIVARQLLRASSRREHPRVRRAAPWRSP